MVAKCFQLLCAGISLNLLVGYVQTSPPTSRADVDEDGHIDNWEFKRALHRRQTNREEPWDHADLRALRFKADLNADGYITEEELKALLNADDF